MEFHNLRIFVLPLHEQRKIAEELDCDCDEIANLMSALHQSIALAKERRAALITAAVTVRIPLEEMQA